MLSFISYIRQMKKNDTDRCKNVKDKNCFIQFAPCHYQSCRIRLINQNLSGENSQMCKFYQQLMGMGSYLCISKPYLPISIHAQASCFTQSLWQLRRPSPLHFFTNTMIRGMAVLQGEGSSKPLNLEQIEDFTTLFEAGKQAQRLLPMRETQDVI